MVKFCDIVYLRKKISNKVDKNFDNHFTRDGKVLKISAMGDSHLCNTIKKLSGSFDLGVMDDCYVSESRERVRYYNYVYELLSRCERNPVLLDLDYISDLLSDIVKKMGLGCDVYHVNKDGSRVLIRDMETSHLLNMVRWIERKSVLGYTLYSYVGGYNDGYCDEEVLYGERCMDFLGYNNYVYELERRGVV